MSVDDREQLLIVSDFNADVLAGLVANDPHAPAIAAKATGLGRALPTLLDAGAPCWSGRSALFVWMRPEAVSRAFLAARDLEPVDHAQALREVDAFADAVVAASARVRTTLVASFHLPAEHRGYGMLDHAARTGVRALLLKMNARLAERLDGRAGVFVLDSSRWFECRDPVSSKMWYLAKVPYSNDVFKSAARDAKAALRGVRGEARKVVICDLDDTLWGGIVGDAGWENLRLGGHDAIGEAHADFQRALKALTRRGVILAIVSKNTESVALEAIERHPEMVLRRGDFAGWRINWSDKAGNVAELLRELNLGQQSAVFLDDNPVERARVAEALPEVLVPELPKDKLLYPEFLRRLDCFDTPVLSDEDRERAAMYGAERERRAALESAQSVGSLDDWLATIGIEVDAEPLDGANLQRTAQLLNKTNQMNLRTRRLTEAELEAWTRGTGRRLWTFRVADRFGDSGLTGIASIELDGAIARIVDFVLSCRVMGKRVEETIVHHLAEEARALGARTLVADHLPTKKNAPCLEFWERSGLARVDGSAHSFAWDLAQPYPKPRAVRLRVLDGASRTQPNDATRNPCTVAARS